MTKDAGGNCQGDIHRESQQDADTDDTWVQDRGTELVAGVAMWAVPSF